MRRSTRGSSAATRREDTEQGVRQWKNHDNPTERGKKGEESGNMNPNNQNIKYQGGITGESEMTPVTERQKVTKC